MVGHLNTTPLFTATRGTSDHETFELEEQLGDGATVFGVSADSPYSQWPEQHGIECDLVSDLSGDVIRAYGLEIDRPYSRSPRRSAPRPVPRRPWPHRPSCVYRRPRSVRTQSRIDRVLGRRIRRGPARSADRLADRRRRTRRGCRSSQLVPPPPVCWPRGPRRDSRHRKRGRVRRESRCSCESVGVLELIYARVVSSAVKDRLPDAAFSEKPAIRSRERVSIDV